MSTKPQHILVLTDWYLPGYKAGGPIRSLANLIAALQDVQFHVVTRNTDHYSTEPYTNIKPNTWIKHSANCQVFYFDEKSITLSAIKAMLSERDYDKVYLNSLFSPKFTLLPLIAIKQLKLKSKTILAPRGMLKSGALSVKAGKKKAFLTISKMIGLYNGISWHATSEEEVKEIKQHFSKATNILLAPNIASTIAGKKDKPLKKASELRLICIARISAEKGITEALTYLRDAQLKGNVRCDFYGTIQNEVYLNECKAMALSVEGVAINFKGEVPPHEIPALLAQYHFFYMPTLGENFGHAIAEALNSATPVIISNKTPWRNLQAQNAGWDLPLESNAFVKVLGECLLMDHDSYQRKSESAYQLARSISLDEKIIEAQYSLFQ